MSKPRNPLDTYRSYSYHHILLVCDGTETAESLANNEEQLSQYFRNATEDAAIDRFQTLDAPNGGQYVVLINGVSDALFSIKSAKWQSIVMPTQSSKTGISHQTTMAVDGELVIQEALGVNFLNEVTRSIRRLGTDVNGVAFMLKTIFVGITDEGREDYISNVKPLLFFLTDINAIFDATGAQYTITFVGMTNGAGHLKQFTSLVDKFKFRLQSDDTLLTAMQRLEERINERYEKQKQELSRTFERCNIDVKIEDQFFDVKYEIELDEFYHDFQAGTATLPSNQETNRNDSVISLETDSMNITSLLDRVMRSSQDVIDQKEKSANGKQTFHKITTALQTRSPNVNQDAPSFVVKYYIRPFESAIITEEQASDPTFRPVTDAEVEEKGTGIEFDYIFTGKNIDVLDFDLKLQFGMTFFQTLLAQPSLPLNPTNTLTYQVPEQKARGTGQFKGPGEQIEGEVTKRPLFLGMQPSTSLLRNARNPGAQMSYASLLARHAALENIEASLKIRGNPQLLGDTTQLPNELEVALNDNLIQPTIPGNEEVRLEPDEEPNPINNRYHQFPTYIKVNVFMPNINSINSDASIYNNDYAQNFWYKGWYFLHSVTHEFDNGNFTQELKMFSLPTDIATDTTLPCTSDENNSTSITQQEISRDARRAGRNRENLTANAFPTGPTGRNNTNRANDPQNNAIERTVQETNARRGRNE